MKAAPAAGEEGYALVAAVASILVFASMSLALLESSRATAIAARAEIDGARLAAATDAGFALAQLSLMEPGPAGPVPIDGSARRVRFGAALLDIAIEDEQGKLPLNALDDKQARRLFGLLGAEGDRLEIMTDSFLDWIDDDDDARPNGAEADYYEPRHIRPRNGNLKSVDEIGLIRGFDPTIVAALKPIATVHFGRGSFRPEHASLIAIEALEGDDEGAVDLINRRRALAGQEVALAIGDAQSRIGQTLTVAVTVQLDDGARRKTRELVVLTGDAARPYVVRERE